MHTCSSRPPPAAAWNLRSSASSPAAARSLNVDITVTFLRPNSQRHHQCDGMYVKAVDCTLITNEAELATLANLARAK